MAASQAEVSKIVDDVFTRAFAELVDNGIPIGVTAGAALGLGIALLAETIGLQKEDIDAIYAQTRDGIVGAINQKRGQV